jgi:hypothetical protein
MKKYWIILVYILPLGLFGQNPNSLKNLDIDNISLFNLL